MPQNSLKALPMVTVDAATLGAGFLPLNTPGFAHPVLYLRIINAATKDLTISFDGINNHDFIRSDREYFLPAQLNGVPNNHLSVFRQGTQIFGKCVGATGYIYIAAYYV